MKTQVEQNGIVTLTPEAAESLKDSHMLNEDLRPTTREEHHWTAYNFSSLWIGMCICIPTYTMSSGLIALGMNWWQAIVTIILGNLIVLIPVLLNSHAGAKFGIPYPVFARLWFGSKGAHIPAVARALVAAAWFGINCWYGGAAIDTLLVSMSGWEHVSGHIFIAFFAFWALNVIVAYRGPEAIRKMEFWAAPILIVLGLALLVWALVSAGGFGPMLSAPSKFSTSGQFFAIFFPSLTGVIAFWATLALNIPDFGRYAKSQKAQIVGQSIALPGTMGLFAFIGVAVTSATVVIFGQAIWDPAALMAHFPPFVILIGTFGIILAALTTNVAANVVAPARAAENLWPRKITFAGGAIITGLLSLAMQPWYLVGDIANYIFVFLGGYGALLGPIDGIAIADYWLVRQRKLSLTELYSPNGRYSYASGFNMKSIYAFAAGILISVIGLVVPGLHFLWDNAWTIGLLVSGCIYGYLMRDDASRMSDAEYAEITVQMDTSAAAEDTAGQMIKQNPENV
ncbi:NCS1 family nucleobase:cation symporter-1 [Sporolactobacillus sp. CPB3-1]|uniref:NCS1 family nucleobase:cation symporter-1 n=1 Tax=Sporolactobacillus mangiferae TaxID=2940498 RepID=A0ABT0M9M7_9BACL|nr:NCS1 family nucleobase:cation symporter-1 [Sporolactobacillus mangiferae]MCL1631581.1 NCS1 family nucleobase:cation symporter-1 [Sporolactobacillus mangiferae]